MKKLLQFVHARDNIRTSLKTGELDKIRKKSVEIVSELSDKL